MIERNEQPRKSYRTELDMASIEPNYATLEALGRVEIEVSNMAHVLRELLSLDELMLRSFAVHL